MRQSKCSEAQIVALLREGEAGVPVAGVPVAGVPVAEVPVAEVPVAEVPVAEVPVAEVLRKHGISRPTFYAVEGEGQQCRVCQSGKR